MSDLPLRAITVGARRREDMGDLEGLAQSIEKYGLLHPVVVDEAGNLVAGERRLRACESIGWTMIPTRNLGDLTEAERREIELEENLRRKDLTPYERSKTLTALVETARDIAEQEEELRPKAGRNSRGHPSEAGSYRDVEERTRVPRSSAQKAVEHVETADLYPFMQSPDWSQNAVLKARKHLDAMPEPVRAVMATMVSEPAVPVKTALQMIEHVRELPSQPQQEIARLYRSEDERDRSLAKTKAAQLPPNPDPQVLLIGAALREIEKCIRTFPSDAWTERLSAVMDELKGIQQQIRESHAERATEPNAAH